MGTWKTSIGWLVFNVKLKVWIYTLTRPKPKPDGFGVKLHFDSFAVWVGVLSCWKTIFGWFSIMRGNPFYNIHMYAKVLIMTN